MIAGSRRFTYTGATLLACALPFAFGCSPKASVKKDIATESTAATAPVSGSTVDTPVSTTTESIVPANVSFKEAHAAYVSGNYQDAVRLYTGYTANHTSNAWGYYMLGLSSWKAGDLAGAESAFNTALTLEPTHERSLYNSARVLIEAGKASEALPRVEQILSQDPTSGEGYRLLGRTQYALGQVDEAVDAYQQALAIDVNDVWAMNNLGLIFIQQGRFEDAVPTLARAAELKGTSAVIQNNLGVALERTGRFVAAAEAYEAALAADSGYGKASVALARVTGRPNSAGVAETDLAALSIRFQEWEQGWRNEGDSTSSTVAQENSDTMAGETEQKQQ
jgi:tetratricopeptide (TPR) repeat protein